MLPLEVGDKEVCGALKDPFGCPQDVDRLLVDGLSEDFGIFWSHLAAPVVMSLSWRTLSFLQNGKATPSTAGLLSPQSKLRSSHGIRNKPGT